jgi:hypothetical protein
MDEGVDVDVEAQMGPVDDELREPEPLKWMEAALLCLMIFTSIVTLASGIACLFVRPSDVNGVPVPPTELVGFGFVIIVLESALTPCLVSELVNYCRKSRQVEAMTRLHVVPALSRR